MADETPATADTGLPAVSLLANSYDLHALIAGAKHAEDLKTEKGREEALRDLPEKLALNQDVVKGLASTAVPEDTVVQETTDAQGDKVVAPVSKPDATATTGATKD
jgi:hypothetical protein